MRKLVLLFALVCMFIPAFSTRAAGLSLNIYYAGPDGGVRSALGLDKEVRFTSDLAMADVFVLNGQIPDADVAAIRSRVQSGAGLLLVLGPNLTVQALRRKTMPSAWRRWRAARTVWSNQSSGTAPRRCGNALS